MKLKFKIALFATIIGLCCFWFFKPHYSLGRCINKVSVSREQVNDLANLYKKKKFSNLQARNKIEFLFRQNVAICANVNINKVPAGDKLIKFDNFNTDMEEKNLLFSDLIYNR